MFLRLDEGSEKIERMSSGENMSRLIYGSVYFASREGTSSVVCFSDWSSPGSFM